MGIFARILLAAAFIVAQIPAESHPWRGWDVRVTVDALGMSSSLETCVDVGSATSYSSGQTLSSISDIGTDTNFFLGTTSASQASDPTFNGTADSLSSSEYFSFDGGDSFRYNTSNETWMDSLHKDNALFTNLMWVYLPIGSSQALWGTNGGGATVGPGARLSVTAAGQLQFMSTKSGTNVLNISASGLTISNNTWTMVGVIIDEAAGNGWFIKNDQSEVFTSTYSAPSAAAAAQTFEIGSLGGTTTQLNSGARFAASCWWTRALSTAEIMAWFQATRVRFGI